MVYPTDPGLRPGMAAAVEAGIADASDPERTAEQQAVKEKEANEVKTLWKEYDTARKFDKDSRAQYAVDRRYAAGTANLDWAVSANLIGAFIDILVSFLYARNPDVSVTKAARVDNRGTKQEDDLAKTIQLVVSSLWKAPTAGLKATCKKQVRSVLTVGAGWFKAIVISKGTNIPQMRSELNDARDNIARLEAVKIRLTTPNDDPAADPLLALSIDAQEDPLTPEEADAKLMELQQLETSLLRRLEVAVRKGLVIDFVAAQDMQVSLDVSDIADHLNGGWNANAIYRPVATVRALFPRLNASDLSAAKEYYQRQNRELTPLATQIMLTGLAGTEMNAEEAEQYVAEGSRAGVGEQGIPFVKVVELWDRRTNHVHTMIEGIDKWAKEPYQPDYPSTRFFPYFCLAFFPVDGARHPQSLTWRLMKLQDEYCSQRSSQRLTRQRAIPGTMFNASGVGPDEIKKLERSVHQEFIGIKPVNPDAKMRDLFAAKPVDVGDPRLYDTTPVVSDMERRKSVV